MTATDRRPHAPPSARGLVLSCAAPVPEGPGGLHPTAIPVGPERWEHLRGTLDAAGIEHVVHSGVSIYSTDPDPDGARIELIADPLGEMCGHTVR